MQRVAEDEPEKPPRAKGVDGGQAGQGRKDREHQRLGQDLELEDEFVGGLEIGHGRGIGQEGQGQGVGPKQVLVEKDAEPHHRGRAEHAPQPFPVEAQGRPREAAPDHAPGQQHVQERGQGQPGQHARVAEPQPQRRADKRHGSEPRHDGQGRLVAHALVGLEHGAAEHGQRPAGLQAKGESQPQPDTGAVAREHGHHGQRQARERDHAQAQHQGLADDGRSLARGRGHLADHDLLDAEIGHGRHGPGQGRDRGIGAVGVERQAPGHGQEHEKAAGDLDGARDGQGQEIAGQGAGRRHVAGFSRGRRRGGVTWRRRGPP